MKAPLYLLLATLEVLSLPLGGAFLIKAVEQEGFLLRLFLLLLSSISFFAYNWSWRNYTALLAGRIRAVQLWPACKAAPIKEALRKWKRGVLSLMFFFLGIIFILSAFSILDFALAWWWKIVLLFLGIILGNISILLNRSLHVEFNKT